MTDAEKKLIVRLEQLDAFKTALLGVVYTKPGTGIPKTDLAEAVQNSLNLADSALQASDLATLNQKVAALESLISDDAENPTAAIDKFNEIVAFLASITNTQTLEGILSGINDAIAAKYTKPGTGIPKSDLASDVQTSLGKADTALQEHQDISGKKDKQTAVSDPTADGNAVSFIDTFSQNANGEATVTKKTVPNAAPSTSGVGGNAGLMSASDKEKLDEVAYATTAQVQALFA